MSTIPAKVRALVRERDAYCCQMCGRYLGLSPNYSIQHRRAKGMGGSRLKETNLPGNLLLLCGHATEPDRCHSWVESHPEDARILGFRVDQGVDPTTVPVRTIHGWRLYDNDGGWAEVAA